MTARPKTNLEAMMNFEPIRNTSTISFSTPFFLFIASSECPNCQSKTQLLNAYHVFEHLLPQLANDHYYPLFFCDVGIENHDEGPFVLEWVSKTIDEEINTVPRLIFFATKDVFFRVSNNELSTIAEEMSPLMLTEWADRKMSELYKKNLASKSNLSLLH